MSATLRNTFLTAQHDEENPLLRQRAQSLLVLLFAALIGLLIALVGAQIYSAVTGIGLGLAPINLALALIAVTLLYLLARAGRYYTAARGLVLLGLMLSYVQMLNGLGHYSAAATAVFPVLAAGLLLSWRTMLLAVLLLIFGASQVALSAGFETAAEPWLGLTAVVLAVALQLYVFVNRIQSPAQNLASEVQKLQRTMRLRLLPDTIDTEEQLHRHVLRLLVNDLGHTVAQVYRADENGEIIQRLGVGYYVGGLDVQDDVNLSQGSGIYTALRTLQTVLLDEDTPPRERRHLLPGVATGIAVPLVYDGQVYGVLDVQQSQQVTLRPSDVHTVELIAQQVSAIIAKMRTVDDLRFDLTQQQRTLEQQRVKLLRYEQSTQRATLDSWSSYMQQRGVDFMGFDLENAQLSPELQMAIPEGLESALEAGEITVTQEEDRQRVTVPILLSGQPMGAMTFTLPPGEAAFDQRQRELVEGVVQRLALALENKRLFEQTQSQVERERLANEVGGVLLSATDVQRMLEIAAEQFNDALGAVQTRINIQPEPSDTMEEQS